MLICNRLLQLICTEQNRCLDDITGPQVYLDSLKHIEKLDKITTRAQLIH